MSEVWVAAAVTVVGGAISGRAAEKKAKADQKFQEGMTLEESKLAAQRAAHERALEDFYTQRDRAKKQRGLDQYRQFSTMGEFAPEYDASGEPRVADPVMPKYSDFDETPPEEEDGKKKDSKNLLSKRVALHKKARDPFGIF